MKNHSLLAISLLAMPGLLQAQNTFPASGNVGIGTTSPNQKLQVVNGNIRVSDPGSYPFGIDIDMHAPGGWAREYSITYNETGKLMAMGVLASGDALSYAYIGGNISTNTATHASPWMVFLPSGNVGIGTKTPGSKLSVNGEIAAKKVRVTETGWPDYVFDTAYRLPDLSTMVACAQQVGHLPGMPTAREVAGKGMDMGAVVKVQTEKIEQLLLYLLRQQEQIQQLTDRVHELEKNSPANDPPPVQP